MKKRTEEKTSDRNVKKTSGKITLELLAERHDALARYVGVPCYVNPDAVSNIPAIPTEQGKPCKGFAGYDVSLAPFVEDFDEIVFTGETNNGDVVCGYIVDKDGKIESVADKPIKPGALLKLPLTPNSHKLYATVAADKGKVETDNIIIKLYSSGMRTEYQRVFTEILSRVMKLEEELKDHKQTCNSAGCTVNE